MPDERDGQDPARNPYAQPFLPGSPEATIEQRVMALEAQVASQDKQEPASKLLGDVKTAEWWLIGVNAVLVIVNAVLVIVTIGIACIYSRQLTQMTIATGLTRTSLIDTENVTRDATQVEVDSKLPAIFPLTLDLSNTISKDGSPGIRVELEMSNVGETPAIRPQFQWGYGHNPPNNTTTYTWPLNTTWKQSIWTKGVSGADYQEIPQKDFHLPLYVYGVVQYLDVFPKSKPSHCRKDHRIQWSIQIYSLSLKGKNGLPQWDAFPIGQGSCFDEWCGEAYTNPKNEYKP